jgi:carbonic anhydrase
MPGTTRPELPSDPSRCPSRERLLDGVERYRREHLPRHAEIYARHADRQTPHTLFVTCSDSRIQPVLITCTDPGELFIVRNVGNMVPPYDAQQPPPAGASLEYAVGVLEVSAIVVCAHSRCGAIAALTQPSQVPASLASVHAWIVATEARAMVERLPSSLSQDDTAKLNALLQLDHVRTYPVVQEHVEAGRLRLHAWFFDIATGDLEEWRSDERRWMPIG